VENKDFSDGKLAPKDESLEESTGAPELHSLHEMLDVLEVAARQKDPFSFGDALDVIGNRSFAPLLLLPGLIMAVPGPADIPGVPIVLSIPVIIIAIQMVMKRDHLWMPQWLQKQKVASNTVDTMIGWARRPASWVDSITKKRWPFFLGRGGYLAMASVCVVIAAATPILEFIPFSANVAGAAIAAIGLAIMARDGLIAAIAMTLSFSVILIVSYQLI
jgi:hypothetical protein